MSANNKSKLPKLHTFDEAKAIIFGLIDKGPHLAKLREEIDAIIDKSDLSFTSKSNLSFRASSRILSNYTFFPPNNTTIDMLKREAQYRTEQLDKRRNANKQNSK